MFPFGLKVLLGEAQADFSSNEPSARQGVYLKDWLYVNQLQHCDVSSSLGRIISNEIKAPVMQGELDVVLPKAESAWQLCCEALLEGLPELSSEIYEIFNSCPKCLEPNIHKHSQAFTYDLGVQKLPFVSLHYRGRPSDILAMAHEFGHALQIVTSWKQGAEQMPPVARECCAFLAEKIMLRYLETEQPLIFKEVILSWQKDDQIYFSENTHCLMRAVDGDGSQYCYEWNYPLARFIADDFFKTNSSSKWVELFQSGMNAPDILEPIVSNSLDVRGAA